MRNCEKNNIKCLSNVKATPSLLHRRVNICYFAPILTSEPDIFHNHDVRFQATHMLILQGKCNDLKKLLMLHGKHPG